MENNKILSEIKSFLFFMIVFFVVFVCAGFLAIGNKSEIVFILGILGIVTLFALFLNGIILNKRNKILLDENIQHQNFISLIEKVEANPEKFYKKVNLLSYVGNIYIIILLLSIILSFLGILMMGFAIDASSVAWAGPFGAGLIGIAYIVVQSLYIKPYKIKGHQITRSEYPEIYKIINNATKKINASSLDKVFIFPDNNCFVSCIPVGFGLHNQNILFVGLHILEILNGKELEAVLLHELAHIYHEDTLISNKINKSITRWYKILESSEQKGIITSFLLTNFAKYYINKMEINLSAISQQKELNADKEAVKYVDKNIYFTAMAKIELMQYFFNRPIEETWLDIRSFDAAPQNYYDLLFSEFYRHYEANKEMWNNQIAKSISSKYDTHPSFSERMKYLRIEKYEIELDFNTEEESDELEIKKLKEVFNREWYDEVHEGWNEYCKEYKESKRIVDSYIQTDDIQKDIDYALALETLCKYDTAMEVYNRILYIYSDNDVALFRKGLLLLNKNDESGIELVKKAMELNNEHIEFGLINLGSFLNDSGLEDKKKELFDWSIEMSRIETKRRAELGTLYPNDNFVPTTLDEKKVLEIKRTISEMPKMVSAYLVEKKLQYSKSNLVILAILYKGKYIEVEVLNRLKECLQILSLPYIILDLRLNKNANIYLMKPISKVEGAEIYNIKRKNNK